MPNRVSYCEPSHIFNHGSTFFTPLQGLLSECSNFITNSGLLFCVSATVLFLRLARGKCLPTVCIIIDNIDSVILKCIPAFYLYRTSYRRVSSVSFITVYSQQFGCCNGYEQSGSTCLRKYTDCIYLLCSIRNYTVNSSSLHVA